VIDLFLKSIILFSEIDHSSFVPYLRSAVTLVKAEAKSKGFIERFINSYHFILLLLPLHLPQVRRKGLLIQTFDKGCQWFPWIPALKRLTITHISLEEKQYKNA